MADTDLFTPDTDQSLIAYSSPPNSKIGRNASLSLEPGVYHQIEAVELEKIPRSLRILITSLQSIASNIEGNWIKNNLINSNIENKGKVTPKIVIFREDLFAEYQKQYGRTVKTSFFSNQLTSLKKSGVLQATPDESHKKQPRKLLIRTFKNLIQDQIKLGTNLTPKPRRGLTNFNTHKELTHLYSNEVNGASLSGLPEKIEFSIQDIYLNGTFDPVMALDTRTKGVRSKSRVVFRHGYPLKIQSFSDEFLMGASDQGLTRQVYSLCNMEVQRRVTAKLKGIKRGGSEAKKGELRKLLKSQIPNLFVLNEIDLAKLTDTDPHRIVNRDNVVNIFERIAGTRFKADASENPIFSKALSWIKLPDDVSSSEFMMRYWDIKQLTRARDGLRIFVFSIDDHAFQSMLVKPERPTLYKAPLSLAHEKIGLAHIIHNWVRKHGIEQQDRLFEKEFGIDELYRELNISADHPQWDTLSVENRERLTAAHKKSVSSQLTQLHKKHRVGDKWTNNDSAEVTRSIFHGVESWQISYNSRNRKFRFRVDPTDQLIGQSSTTKRIDTNNISEQSAVSVWEISPDVLETLTNRLVVSGASVEDATNRIYEWQLFHEKTKWKSIEAITKSIEKAIDDILNTGSTLTYTETTLLDEWMPSLELKQALYKEAEQVDVNQTRAKFLVTAKVDEFKKHSQHKDFASNGVIESQFYTYFIRGLSFEVQSDHRISRIESGAVGTNPRDVPFQERMFDTSWAENFAIVDDGKKGNESEPLVIDSTVERED